MKKEPEIVKSARQQQSVERYIQAKITTKRLCIFLVLLIGQFDALSCDCDHPKDLKNIQTLEYNISDLIFIGQVIDIDIKSMTYKIVVVEGFKGQVESGDTLTGENIRYCTPVIDKLGKWLIYGNLTNKTFQVNECGLSRSFESPENNPEAPNFPPPPPDSDFQNKDFIEKQEKEFQTFKIWCKAKSSTDLEEEIMDLRTKKK